MSASVTDFQAYAPLKGLTELPAKAWRHRLECLDTSHTGFQDRIGWVNELLQSAMEWRHMELITAQEQVAMMRILRSRLQDDLGDITVDDAALSARNLP